MNFASSLARLLTSTVPRCPRENFVPQRPINVVPRLVEQHRHRRQPVERSEIPFSTLWRIVIEYNTNYRDVAQEFGNNRSSGARHGSQDNLNIWIVFIVNSRFESFMNFSVSLCRENYVKKLKKALFFRAEAPFENLTAEYFSITSTITLAPKIEQWWFTVLLHINHVVCLSACGQRALY